MNVPTSGNSGANKPKRTVKVYDRPDDIKSPSKAMVIWIVAVLIVIAIVVFVVHHGI